MTKDAKHKKTIKKHTAKTLKKQQLEERRLKVKSLIVRGYTSFEIAKVLKVSTATMDRDIIAIKNEIKKKLKTNTVENLIFEVGLQTDEIIKQFWKVYTTTVYDNAKLGALNGITRQIDIKIGMLQKLGILETETINLNIKRDFSEFKEFLNIESEKIRNKKK